MALALLFGGLAVLPVLAQDPAPAAPEPPKEAKVTLWGMWKTGGWSMYPIGLLSVAGVAFTIFSFLAVKEDKMVQLALVPTIQDQITHLDFRGVSSTCVGSPGVMTNVVNAGMMRLADGLAAVETVEKAMEEAAVEENVSGMRPINYLSIIASIAPMFGLLGTVSGMIKAFNKIGLGGMGDPEKLAGDIGEAMITTAFGLLVGIPAMFFYFQLKSRFQSNMAKIGRVTGNLTHHLAAIFQKVEAGEISIDQFNAPAPMTSAAPPPASVPAPTA
jgi:biopolymer transport protein ExbB